MVTCKRAEAMPSVLSVVPFPFPVAALCKVTLVVCAAFALVFTGLLVVPISVLALLRRLTWKPRLGVRRVLPCGPVVSAAAESL